MSKVIELTEAMERETKGKEKRTINLKGLTARVVLIGCAAWGLFTFSLVLTDWVKREYELIRTEIAENVIAEYLDGKSFETDEKKRAFVLGSTGKVGDLQKALFILSRQHETCAGTLYMINDMSKSIEVMK